jgi:hypothetical protein
MRWALLLSLLLPGVAVAHPADDILAHVPKGTALCLVVRDAERTLKQLADSPFAKWLPTSGLGKRRLKPVTDDKVREFTQTLEAQFGLTPTEIVEAIFGDAVIFAFQPGPPERSLILVKPRKPEVAAKFLAKLDELQTGNEVTKVTTESMHGIRVTVRHTAAGREAYSLHDGILAFGGDLDSLKHYHDGRAAKEAAPVAATLAKLKSQASTLNLWIDPRAFDAEFKQITGTTPADRAVQELIAGVWQSIEHLSLHADMTDVLTIRASMTFAESKVPAAAAKFVPPTLGQSSLWAAIPADALLAVAGRMAFADAVKGIDATGTAANSLGPIVGKDKLPTVLEAIGPDWGLWLTAPEMTGHWLPEWTFALKIRPDATGKIDTAKSLFDGVDAGAQLLRFAYNASNPDQIELKDDTVAGTKIRVLASEKLPAGTRPCFGIRQGYFLLASHPDRIGRFAAPPDDPGTATTAPLVRLSATGLRGYLLKHGERLMPLLAAGQSSAKAKADLAGLCDILEAFDRIELAASHEAGVSRLILTATPVKPLR